MAAVLAEAMAKEFSAAANPSCPRPLADEKLANMREYKRATDGKFSEVDGAPGKNPDSAETQATEIGKGKSAVTKCLKRAESDETRANLHEHVLYCRRLTVHATVRSVQSS